MADAKDQLVADLTLRHTSEVSSDANAALGEYSPAEVRKAIRRVDLLVVLPLVFMFVFLQFDRTNLGNALTSTLKKDAKITGDDVNVGQTLFTLGIALWEIPSNVIIRRVGAHRWLPLLMFLWGTVTWSQVFLNSRASFLATRFLLGTFEAGFIPGAAYYLGQFVTRKEVAFRYALLWSANNVAGALGGVLALGLLSLDGRHGLAGWQWLFAIEGSLTCFMAIVAFLHLPQGPLEAGQKHRLFGNSFKILTPAQGALLVDRAIQDDPSKGKHKSWVQPRDFDVFLNPRLYGHLLMAFLSSVMLTPINTYAPSFIKALGFKGYSANGLNSVGPFCNLLIALPLAWFSDRTQQRGPFVLVGFLITVAGLLWMALPPKTAAAGVLYAGVIVTEAGMGSVQGLNAAWLASNIEDRHRPVALGSYVMVIQFASFLGTNLFHANQAPRYKQALLGCAGSAIAASVVCVAWTALYRWVFGEGLPLQREIGKTEEVHDEVREESKA